MEDEPAICDLIQKAVLSAGLEALTLTRSARLPVFCSNTRSLDCTNSPEVS